MISSRTRNLLIGAFTVSACLIFVGMILFLKPTLGDGKKEYKVRFANISGIAKGTRVSFAGRPVGEVVQIREVKDARSEEGGHASRVYLYELTLKVDSSVDVYSSDEIAIRTSGLMGERSVGIFPRRPGPGEKSLPIPEGMILFANPIDPLENTFTQVTKVAARTDTAVGHFDDWFMQQTEALSQGIRSLSALLTTAHESELIPTLRTTADLLNANLSSIHESLSEDRLLQKITALASHLCEAVEAFNGDGVAALQNINQFTRDLSQGTGTLGKLVTGEELYLRLNSLMSKAETLMNDINHYGILFQYDKKWQRSRTKRANLLKALDSPREFKSYFEGEVDSIHTALGRLTELLERSSDLDSKTRLAHQEDFRRQFGDLLRKVDGLSQSIKLYNQELVQSLDLPASAD